MKFRNPQNWTDLEEMRGILFFVQRLEELTYAYTLDSYKTPTTSINGLIDEAIRVLDEGHQTDATKKIKSSEHIIAEIRLRMKGNWVARSLASLDIDVSLDKIENSNTLGEKIRWLNLLSAEMEAEHYLAKIVENVLLLAKSKEKSKLEFLAKEMASLLQSRGMSRDHINMCIAEEFYSEKPVTIDTFKPFCQRVYPHHHTYRVLLGLSADVDDIDDDVLSREKIITFTLSQFEELTST